MKYTPEQQRQHRLALCDALESGRYTQDISVLRTDRGFCCLGVTCDISGLGQWNTDKNIIEYTVGDFSESEHLPGPVSDYYGFDSYDGTYDGGALTHDNDIQELPFAEIAEIIRSEPPGLVVG